MIQEQKQALHIENGKSFSRSEANENERRWDDRKIDQLNRDPANNYDRTRMHLNFEIGIDGKIHPLGYMDKRLDERIQERLDELEYHPFKATARFSRTSAPGSSSEETTSGHLKWRSGTRP